MQRTQVNFGWPVCRRILVHWLILISVFGNSSNSTYELKRQDESQKEEEKARSSLKPVAFNLSCLNYLSWRKRKPTKLVYDLVLPVLSFAGYP